MNSVVEKEPTHFQTLDLQPESPGGFFDELAGGPKVRLESSLIHGVDEQRNQETLLCP